jgi:threonine efflux protein
MESPLTMDWVDPNLESALSLVVTVTLFTTFLIMLVVPGQDFVMIARMSVARSRGVGIAAAAGVSTGLLFWLVASILGVSALLDDNAGLSRLLRLGGATLLAAFGVFSVGAALRLKRKTPGDMPLVVETAKANPLLRGWAAGLFSNLSNVKLLIFFGSIFSGVLPEGLTPIETVLIAVALGALSFGWFSLVAVLGSHPRVARAYQRASRGMDVVFGLVFIAIGTVFFVSGL